ncbi:MAG: four helix bundle protein [Candidatus Sungbacteria bacterium RIFCSPHIGHO2_02_FULL_47_11]|uniref:Four helix bundle protein n=1 Tax=Candidatus Sungbacteria bacterium RIFCSPHIGHO2_02_FULL_47_11 TaxID=1802270 RepID=A0A1G2KKB3_9BACT|nr:MAG: four helix bundle protein [Candidatus Sungbacteria bacterium RIFCSPHIGHO2_02_FULL_47_11]
MSNDETKLKFDLEERTAKFAEMVIVFCNSIKRTPVNTPIIVQLVKAATSIGANYCEADDAESKKDFRHKIGICKKEARETKYWLRMISRVSPETKEQARTLWDEVREFHLIFVKIVRSTSH